MSQPVKLSDALMRDARQAASIAEQSIAGQIEFWARLGRAVEPLLSGDRALALRRAGDQQPLASLIATVDSDQGRRRVADVLAALPFPHYEAAERPGLLVRIDANRRHTEGKFVRGEFRAAAGKKSRAAGTTPPRRRQRRGAS